MIQKIFDLRSLPEESYIEGITDHIPTNHPDESRGEFVGYLSKTNYGIKLFRDRVGARNLYYSLKGGNIYVSTDILWVVNNCGWVPTINDDYLRNQYFPFQVSFNMDTIYEHVFKVMPGEISTFSQGPVIDPLIKYWTLEFNEHRFNPLDLHDLILDAINYRKQIIIHDKYTSYLSGGIDSSTITSIVKPDECFSGVYEQEECSELGYIEEVVEKYNICAHNIMITENRFYQFLSHLPKLIPDPMCGLGVIPQLILAMEAFKYSYRYSWTGEGGDEVFSGYPWNTLIFASAKSMRDLLRDRYMIRWEGMINKVLQDGFAPIVDFLIRRKESGLNWIEMLWDKELGVENNIMKINIEIGLPAILTVDERVGLYSGVMPVSPLCDHNIIDYVASINPEERTKIPKYLLREAMKDVLPGKIYQRYDKMGFPVPVDKWSWPMLDNGKKMTRGEWGLFNVKGIKKMLIKLDR